MLTSTRLWGRDGALSPPLILKAGPIGQQLFPACALQIAGEADAQVVIMKEDHKAQIVAVLKSRKVVASRIDLHVAEVRSGRHGPLNPPSTSPPPSTLSLS